MLHRCIQDLETSELNNAVRLKEQKPLTKRQKIVPGSPDEDKAANAASSSESQEPLVASTLHTRPSGTMHTSPHIAAQVSLLLELSAHNCHYADAFMQYAVMLLCNTLLLLLVVVVVVVVVV